MEVDSPLDDDLPDAIPDGTIHEHKWDLAINTAHKWAFPTVRVGRWNWTFGFNMDSSNDVAFLRDMIRTKRVALNFPKTSLPLDPNPGDDFLEGLSNLDVGLVNLKPLRELLGLQ